MGDRQGNPPGLFGVEQIRSIYAACDETELTGTYAKIVELSRRKGWLKAKDFQLSLTAKKRPDPNSVRQWFKQLSDQGWGELEGEGTQLKFKAFENRKNVNLSTDPPPPQNTEHTTVSAVDNICLPLSTVPTETEQNYESTYNRPHPTGHQTSPLPQPGREPQTGQRGSDASIPGSSDQMEAQSRAGGQTTDGQILSRQTAAPSQPAEQQPDQPQPDTAGAATEQPAITVGSTVYDPVTQGPATVDVVTVDREGVPLVHLNGSVNDWRFLESVRLISPDQPDHPNET